jgi:hypothetical protein
MSLKPCWLTLCVVTSRSRLLLQETVTNHVIKAFWTPIYSSIWKTMGQSFTKNPSSTCIWKLSKWMMVRRWLWEVSIKIIGAFTVTMKPIFYCRRTCKARGSTKHTCSSLKFSTSFRRNVVQLTLQKSIQQAVTLRTLSGDWCFTFHTM